MRLDPQGVAHASISVVNRPGTLAREILIQGAAERDVQDLEATTNGEQREAAALGTCDERELDCVAPRVRFPELGVRLGPVAGGLDIFAAAEHEALHPVEHGACGVGIEQRRHHNGDQARATERLHVGGVQRDPLPPLVGAARRAHRDDLGHPREAEDPGAAAGGGAPKSGQRGLLTLVQSTRTPYSGTARSPAVSWPMLGYPVGGRCDS